MSSSWHVPVKGLFCKVTVTHWFPICLLSHYLMSPKNYIPGNNEVADCKSAAEIYREILPHHHILCYSRPGNLSLLVVCFSTLVRLKYPRMNPIDFNNPMAFHPAPPADHSLCIQWNSSTSIISIKKMCTDLHVWHTMYSTDFDDPMTFIPRPPGH